MSLLKRSDIMMILESIKLGFVLVYSSTLKRFKHDTTSVYEKLYLILSFLISLCSSVGSYYFIKELIYNGFIQAFKWWFYYSIPVICQHIFIFINDRYNYIPVLQEYKTNLVQDSIQIVSSYIEDSIKEERSIKNAEEVRKINNEISNLDSLSDFGIHHYLGSKSTENYLLGCERLVNEIDFNNFNMESIWFSTQTDGTTVCEIYKLNSKYTKDVYPNLYNKVQSHIELMNKRLKDLSDTANICEDVVKHIISQY